MFFYFIEQKQNVHILVLSRFVYEKLYAKQTFHLFK